jgi:hypothetical protein
VKRLRGLNQPTNGHGSGPGVSVEYAVDEGLRSLSLERIFKEMPQVPFRDEVWPKFLRGNAQRVFKL